MKESAILEACGLKKTEIRLKMLSYLIKTGKAVSQPELEKKFCSLADRVTIYRVLAAFEEKGIIHKIIDAKGLMRYALCNQHACNEHHHHDEHVHFNCTTCGEVVCLDEVNVPHIKLPKLYSMQKLSINVEGRCDKCS